jgi:hypothetical protein
MALFIVTTAKTSKSNMGFMLLRLAAVFVWLLGLYQVCIIILLAYEKDVFMSP